MLHITNIYDLGDEKVDQKVSPGTVTGENNPHPQSNEKYGFELKSIIWIWISKYMLNESYCNVIAQDNIFFKGQKNFSWIYHLTLPTSHHNAVSGHKKLCEIWLAADLFFLQIFQSDWI